MIVNLFAAAVMVTMTNGMIVAAVLAKFHSRGTLVF